MTSLCDVCQLGDSGSCYVFPMQTDRCVEFRAHIGEEDNAAVLIAGGIRVTADHAESMVRYGLLCRVLESGL